MSVNRRQARHGRNRDYSKSGSVGIAEAAQNIRNKVSLRDILELTPIAGDLLAAKEVYDEMKKPEPNWYLVGILTAGSIVGLVPGVGDAAAQAIKIGGRAALKGTKKAVDTLSQYGLEIDPSTLGSNLGNVRIVKRGPKPKAETIYYIKDGKKKQFTGTRDEIAKELGLTSADSLKKSSGLGPGGIKWNRGGTFKPSDIKKQRQNVINKQRKWDEFTSSSRQLAINHRQAGKSMDTFKDSVGYNRFNKEQQQYLDDIVEGKIDTEPRPKYTKDEIEFWNDQGIDIENL